MDSLALSKPHFWMMIFLLVFGLTVSEHTIHVDT